MLNTAINYRNNNQKVIPPFKNKNNIKSVVIDFPIYNNRKKLYKDALDAYNKYNLDNKLNLNNLLFDKKDFLNRIALNYLRHNSNFYNSNLNNKSLNYNKLKQLVNNAIFDYYPYLKPVDMFLDNITYH
jgi:hypothetical protein